MNRLVAFAWTCVAIGGCARNSDQKDTVPSEVRRRIAQAIWPENLFDSAGKPERGFTRRPVRPAFRDLQIRPASSIDGMPNVVVYVGQAKVSGCVHCGTYTVAVAQRDTSFVSLLGPRDLEFLAAWAATDRLADTASLRRLVISQLRATCFIGCDVQHVGSRAEVLQGNPFLVPVDANATRWRLPNTYSWQKNVGAVVDFPVYSPGFGVYAVRAEYLGPSVAISVSMVARSGLR